MKIAKLLNMNAGQRFFWQNALFSPATASSYHHSAANRLPSKQQFPRLVFSTIVVVLMFVFNSRIGMTEDGIEVSLQERVTNQNTFGKSKTPSKSGGYFLLKEEFRFSTNILKFPNQMFYNGELIAADAVKDSTIGFVCSSHSLTVMFFSVSTEWFRELTDLDNKPIHKALKEALLKGCVFLDTDQDPRTMNSKGEEREGQEGHSIKNTG